MEEIKEGFLCPICLKDLKSPTHLSSHFEEFHEEDKDVLQQLRNVFGKAKQKILQRPVEIRSESPNQTSIDQASSFVSHGTPGSGGIDIALWETQQPGMKLLYYCIYYKI